MRKLILVGLLAFAMVLVGTAYAEVQSVKVSGDLDVKWISQDNFDLKSKQLNNAGPGTASDGPISNDDGASFFLSTAHVTVDADLSDNVKTSVRLLNQRVWDAHSTDETIHLDNAYVVLKEFLYSPLTVIAGRQNLKYGTGFIVGDGILADPEGIFGVTDPGAIHAGGIGGQYSAYNSFDAVRAILDFAPYTIEGVFAKVDETGTASDDENLFGFLVNYKHGQWDAEVEPYWFFKQDESVAGSAGVTPSDQTYRTYPNNYVHTLGLRLAGSPIENLRINAEGAHQAGKIRNDTPNIERTRNAWAATVDGRYTWAKVRWTPVTGLGWVFFSGQAPVASGAALSEAEAIGRTYTAWNSMYRGSFTTYIQDFFAGGDGAGLYTTADINDTSAGTNRNLIYGDVSVKPLEDLTLFTRFTHARFSRSPRSGRSTYAGDELDWKAVYDYTEDVQLGLWGGFFFPGRYYDQPASTIKTHDTAWTVGSSAAVKF